jgi:hypothetical protein
VIGLFAVTYQRFVLPLIPYLACAAAAGTAWIAERLPGRPTRTDRPTRTGRAWARGLFVAAVLAWPAWTTWRLGSLRVAPDTLEQAAAWLQDHTDAGVTRTFLPPGSDLPLARRPEVLRADAELPRGIRPDPWLDYQVRLLEARGPDLPLFEAGHLAFHLPIRGPGAIARLRKSPEEYLGRLGAEVVVVPVSLKKRNAPAWLLREDARRRGELLARFSPEASEALRPYPFAYYEEPADDPVHFGLRVLRARAVGPTVEVYSLPTHD